MDYVASRFGAGGSVARGLRANAVPGLFLTRFEGIPWRAPRLRPHAISGVSEAICWYARGYF